MPVNVARFRVRYAETDQMGVVYYANYFVWMEIGRVELVRSLGLAYKTLETEGGLLLSVAEANCRYLYPARYDQEIAVETTVQRFHPRLVEFAYKISAVESDTVLATGSTKHLWLDREFRPVRLPQQYLRLLNLS